jgi:hypothetical protein
MRYEFRLLVAAYFLLLLIAVASRAIVETI